MLAPHFDILNRLLLAALVLVLCAAESGAEGGSLVPEGFGAATKGGEGGRVLWVTTLDVEGPGSITEVLDAEGPRVIKFRVAGEIRLSDERKNKLWVGWPHRPQAKETAGGAMNYDSPHSFVTLDGASAPEPGITFTNGGFYIGYGVHDVVIRHIRVQHGPVGGASGDGVCVQAKRVLIDHCTITGAVDETADLSECSDVTVQWCILGIGSKTGHPKGVDHSAGVFVSYGATRVSVHHNLIAKNAMRNPLLYGRHEETYATQERPLADIVNNLIFGCHQGALVGAGMRANLVGNLYVAQRPPAIYLVTKYAAQPKVFMKDNMAVPDQPPFVRVQGPEAPPEPNSPLIASAPFPAPPVRTQPVAEAAKLILAESGARPWARDALEAALVAEVREAAGSVLK